MTGTTSDMMPVGTMSGAPQVLLAHHLKQLKLPTVLREYERVARECAQGGVDHPRYLLRLIELELIDHERRTVERRITAARITAMKSIDTLTSPPSPASTRCSSSTSPAASMFYGARTSSRLATAAPALLDRLTHHVNILTMNGDSYQLKQSAGRRRAITAGAEQNQAPEIVNPDTGEITVA